jgi:hypothetical protein
MSAVKLSISLVYIADGWVKFVVQAGGERIEVHLDNLADGEVQLVRFIQALAAGGFPRMSLRDIGTSQFTAQPSIAEGCCRLVVNSEMDGIVQILDTVTSRNELVAQLSDLAAAIGSHPCYVHEYLLHGTHPSKDYDRAAGAAEDAWTAEVATNRPADDGDDAKTDFVARHVSATLTLPEDRLAWAEDYRTMLRTLKIPDEWLRRNNLEAIFPVSLKGEA